MFTGMEMMACPNLAVPVEVMHHVVEVESGANRYAIGVVGGELARQPKNLGEALATVHMLDAKGYNYSLGMAQVNRTNLVKFGLDSYEKAFEPCPNLSAGSHILASCYVRAGGNWGKAFSCYYSGNFVTGYRDGYVQKVYGSINHGTSASTSSQITSSQLYPIPVHRHAENGMASNDAAHRVAIRTVAINPTIDADVSTSSKPATHPQGGAVSAPHVPATIESAALAVTAPSITGTPTTAFVPQVRGPNDSSPPTNTPTTPLAGASTPPPDKSDLRTESRDAAFVF
jgi:type IV secretion system protein VirB1